MTEEAGFSPIKLKGGAVYITENSEDAYRVVSGSVYVYIVPWSSGQAGRRSLLCQVEKGSLIPAFSYVDQDSEAWRFCLTAAEEAELIPMEGACTMPLKKRFLKKAGIANPGEETYEDVLVDQFRMNLVREDGFLLRTGMDKAAVRNQTSQLIASFFQKERKEEKKKGGQAVYQVMEELCRRSGISIADYERAELCCGTDLTFEGIARVSHIPCRRIVLEETWYEADAGSILVLFGEQEEPAACIPRGQGGYWLYRSGEKLTRLTAELAQQCSPKAWMIYRPFPKGALSLKSFIQYCMKGVSRADTAAVFVYTALASLIGLLIPTLNQKLYDEYIPMGNTGMIGQMGYLIGSFMIGNLAFSVVKSLSSFRLVSRIRSQVQNAVYYRVFELPEKFYRQYESADLAMRIMEIGSLAGRAAQMVCSVAISAFVSVFFLIRMISYSAELTAAALFMTLLFSVFQILTSAVQQKYRKEILELNGKSDSLLFQFILGIEKIRIAGIEDRAVLEYMKSFVKQQKLQSKSSRCSMMIHAVNALNAGIFTMVLYGISYFGTGITMGQFVGFQSAFGMVSGTINGFANAWINSRMMKISYDRVRDLLETEPETSETKRIPEKLAGNIDLEHVSFSYEAGQMPVFSDLSVHIQAGEYVGIAGPSGCGKSTLLKLLLGFEAPDSGRIYYDNQDMEELDLPELRKKFGVVLQDGELISGSIYENITLTSGPASRRKIQKVLDAVGLSEDIEEMPMGLQTVVSEHCNTISGGQKQRILIARSIINEPKVILFDEATSALDNITQSKICEMLERSESTRIVIAHRLSTIRNCHRILVMDQGKIIEEGSFEKLMEQKGMFAELAGRQIL